MVHSLIGQVDKFVLGVGVLLLEIFMADRADVESIPAGQPNEIDERSL